jgi:2,5-diamino-6-(ribosylamino)-4(3H)-pyrimidinone 5'-phosphate reductase
MSLPITTLFMLESLDGKISTGSNDNLDVDKDYKNIDGVKEGLHQYYEIEAETDVFSLNTGRVMAKIGVNEKTTPPEKLDMVTFIIIDNKPHLKESGVEYLCNWVGRLILVTTNKEHPAYNLNKDNLDILYYDELNLKTMLEDIEEKYKAKKVTIQSGGTLNGLFLRENLIDYVHVVVAPILVGGKDVPTLVDGESIKNDSELSKLKSLQLIECNVLDDSYIELIYRVNK